MRVILAAVHITALQFTGTRSVVAGRQLKSKQLVGTEMPSSELVQRNREVVLTFFSSLYF